jgi:hypothetical protein
MGRAPFLSPFWAITMGCGGAICERFFATAHMPHGNIIPKKDERPAFMGTWQVPSGAAADRRLARRAVRKAVAAPCPHTGPGQAGSPTTRATTCRCRLTDDVAKRADHIDSCQLCA